MMKEEEKTRTTCRDKRMKVNKKERRRRSGELTTSNVEIKHTHNSKREKSE